MSDVSCLDRAVNEHYDSRRKLLVLLRDDLATSQAIALFCNFMQVDATQRHERAWGLGREDLLEWQH